MNARSRREAVDWAVAVILAVAMAVAAGLSGTAQPAVRAVAVLSATGLLALAVRRRHPLAALAAVIAVVLIETITASQSVAAPSFLAVMTATYSVGARASVRAATAGLPAAVIGVAAAQLLSPQMASYSHADSIAFFTVILVIAPATAGAVVRARAGLAGRLRQATRRLQEARADRTTSAVAQERQRIATELEAVMLRGLDGMRRHAAARDREEVAELERIARGTLAAMRGLLARFRPGDDVADGSGARRDGTDHAGDRAPAPSLPELRARVAAGLAAETTDPAPPAPLPSRWTLPSARQVDAALTLAALVLAAAFLATRHWPADALLTAGTALPIAWLRRTPLPAAAVCLAATVAYSAVAKPADPLAGLTPTFMLAVPLVTGAVCALRQALGALIACLLCVFLCVVVDPAAHFGQDGAVPAAAFVLACWAVGRLLRDGGRLLTALAETAATVRDENAASARRPVAGERLRIARELHDAGRARADHHRHAGNRRAPCLGQRSSPGQAARRHLAGDNRADRQRAARARAVCGGRPRRRPGRAGGLPRAGGPGQRLRAACRAPCRRRRDAAPARRRPSGIPARPGGDHQRRTQRPRRQRPGQGALLPRGAGP
jgi:signal transduction histidine kinase